MHTFLVRKKLEGEGSLGRRRHRWRDSINLDLKESALQIARLNSVG